MKPCSVGTRCRGIGPVSANLISCGIMHGNSWRVIAAGCVAAVLLSSSAISSPQTPALSFGVMISLPVPVSASGSTVADAGAFTTVSPQTEPQMEAQGNPIQTASGLATQATAIAKAVGLVAGLVFGLYILASLFGKKKAWRQLEEKVARRFARDGWAATLTPPTKDGGFDIDLRCGNERAIVECKERSKGPVGVAIVRQVYGVMKAERAQHAFVVTTTKFTKGGA